MLDSYPVMMGDEAVGVAEVERQGAQYRIECRVGKEAEQAGLQCKDGIYPLGRFVQKGSIWISVARIGSKIWQRSDPKFVVCLEESGEAFEGFVSSLRYAVYSVKDRQVLITKP